MQLRAVLEEQERYDARRKAETEAEDWIGQVRWLNDWR
jgi:hypothetical protein